MNNRIAGGVLLFLLALYGLSYLWDRPRTGSFDPNVINLNPDDITQIKIFPKGQSSAIELNRSEGNWTLLAEGQIYQADQQRIGAMTSVLSQVRADRFAAKSSEKWSEYEVGEDALRVQAFNGDEELVDLRLGRFAFNQQTRSGTSYFRLNGEESVYAVEGFLSLSFTSDLDGLRDKNLWQLHPEDIDRIEWMTLPNWVKDGTGNWTSNDTALDSAKVYDFINSLGGLQSQQFYYGDAETIANPFMTIDQGGTQLTVQSANDENGHLILAFRDGGKVTTIVDPDSLVLKKLLPTTDEE